MSWDDPEERRKAFRKWFGDFLPDSLFQEIEEMMEKMLSQIGEDGFLDPEALSQFMQDPRGMKPFMFGFSMSVDQDGKPMIQRFGDVNPEEHEGEALPPIEPLVDVFEEEDEIIIVADLPGVEKDEIRVRVKGTRVTIEVSNPERPYRKEIQLPVKVQKDKATSSLRNGVLEIRLKKTK